MAGRGVVCLLTVVALTLLRGAVFASKEDVVFSGSSSIVSEAINAFDLLKKLFNWSYEPGTDDYYRRIINLEVRHLDPDRSDHCFLCCIDTAKCAA